jgi:Spy/CpxP family protein refolding chaperone
LWIVSIAGAGCGADESAIEDDLAGPGELRAMAEFEGPHAPPWLEGGNPVAHLERALDAAQVTGAERERVNTLVADFRKVHASEIASLGRAAAKAKAEAEAGNPPDRERWQELVAAEGLVPGTLRDDLRALRRSINDALTPEQRQKLQTAWRGERGGRFARWQKGMVEDLALTPEQERNIQRLVTDFSAKHQGEIAALKTVIEKQGNDWMAGGGRGQGLRGRGPEKEPGPGAGLGPGPQAGARPRDGAGPRGGSGRGLGPHLSTGFKDALTQAGHDPEAFKKDLAALHDQAVALLTAEQQAKLRGHGLHLIRRLLEPEMP